jgi:hypothetical protein
MDGTQRHGFNGHGYSLNVNVGTIPLSSTSAHHPISQNTPCTGGHGRPDQPLVKLDIRYASASHVCLNVLSNTSYEGYVCSRMSRKFVHSISPIWLLSGSRRQSLERCWGMKFMRHLTQMAHILVPVQLIANGWA